MALQFQPPPDWLLQEYMNRKNPVVEGLQGVSQVMQQYAQQKDAKQKEALAKQQRDTATFTATAPYAPEASIPGLAKQYGINIPDAQPPVPSTGTVPSPTAGTPDMQGQPVTQAPAVSSLVQAHVQATGQNPLNLPIPTSKAGLAKYTATRQAQKLDRDLATDPNAPVPFMTKEAALEAGSGNPKTKIIEPTSTHPLGETRQERLGSSLRKELTSSKPYQNLTMAKSAADNISQAVKDPGAYGDLATLFDYMKALDPTSVVREGEQDTFRKTGSFTESMANTMNKLVNGQTITSDQRGEILKYTQNRLKTAHNVYKNHADPTLRQAKRIGADPLEVDPFYGQNFEHLIGADTPAPVSGLAHLSTKELQDLRKKMTAHQSNGN